MRTTFFSLRKKSQRRAAAFAVLAGVTLFAGGAPAWATTYYVAPGGNDSSVGTSLGTAWLTLSKVNSSLQPGDVVRIQPGTYSGSIAPARDGGASSRISYVGSLTSPGAVVVASIDLTGRSYISVKGVTSTGDVNIWSRYVTSTTSVASQHDSVTYVVGRAILDLSGAWFSHVGHCTIGDDTPGDMLRIVTRFQDSTRFCTLEDNVLNLVPSYNEYAIRLAAIRNCSFSRNVFNLRIPPANSASHFALRYTNLDCASTDNKYIFRNNNADQPDAYGLHMRDRSRFNSWTRDTFLVHPLSTYSVKYQFSSAGNTAATGNHYIDGLHFDDWRTVDDQLGSNGNNTWTNCYIQGDGLFGTNQRCHSYAFFGNTFVVKQPLFMQADSLTFRHNTIINTAVPTVVDGEYESDITNSIIRSNIFYGTGSTTLATVVLPAAASVQSDSNLVYSAGGNSNNAFWVRPVGAACRVGPGCSWCDTYGKDRRSQWGDPQFTSVAWASPDPMPRTGSIALSSALWTDGYVGAVRPGTSVGDLIAPAAVGDLALALVSDHTVVLRWTATGDDGNTGQASAYDLRWSNQPITVSNFAAATPVGIQPVPAVAGSTQSYVMTDLVPSTSYYLALRVVDESGNWSDLGNVLEAVTEATDTVPPAPITFGP